MKVLTVTLVIMTFKKLGLMQRLNLHFDAQSSPGHWPNMALFYLESLQDASSICFLGLFCLFGCLESKITLLTASVLIS